MGSFAFSDFCLIVNSHKIKDESSIHAAYCFFPGMINLPRFAASNVQVKKLHKDGKLNLMVDKDLKNNFDKVELEEIVQVALLCTHFNPIHRPKMSEVLRMLEGDGLVEKWESSQTVDTPRYHTFENPSQRYSDFIEESSLVVEAMELSGPR